MDTLYHYCSTASFHAITQSHALWLSSLSLSNDTMEGKLVARAIARLAERDSLESKGFRLLQRIIVLLELAFDGLGFCLSEKDDLLSQWRGYAADATGVSIGFSKEYLKRLAKKMVVFLEGLSTILLPTKHVSSRHIVNSRSSSKTARSSQIEG
jgi:hypothetical protein